MSIDTGPRVDFPIHSAEQLTPPQLHAQLGHLAHVAKYAPRPDEKKAARLNHNTLKPELDGLLLQATDTSTLQKRVDELAKGRKWGHPRPLNILGLEIPFLANPW